IPNVAGGRPEGHIAMFSGRNGFPTSSNVTCGVGLSIETQIQMSPFIGFLRKIHESVSKGIGFDRYAIVCSFASGFLVDW
ncbi:MAG: hypothetical protein ACK5Q1_04425, partial [Limnobacter sp.]